MSSILRRMSTPPVKSRSRSEKDYGEEWWFWCPACYTHHRFITKASLNEKVPTWTFNRDEEEPTFHPSLRNTYEHDSAGKPLRFCHLFVEKGIIRFCADSTHDMAGKSITMEDLP